VSGIEIARLDELAVNEAKYARLGDFPVCVVLDEAGEVHVIGDRCTHGDVSLSDGFVEDGTVECWAHGARFDLASGKPLSLPAYEPVPVFAVTIVDGVVTVDPTPKKVD